MAIILLTTVPAALAEGDDLTGIWTGQFSGKILGGPISGSAKVVITATEIELSVLEQAYKGAYNAANGNLTVTMSSGEQLVFNYTINGDSIKLTGTVKLSIITIEDVVMDMTRKSSDGKVTINIPAEGLFSVGDNTYEAMKGDKVSLTAEVSDNMSEAKITWKSSKSKIAAITGKTGLLKFKAAGETAISATAKQGKTTVKDDIIIRVVELKLNKAKAKLFLEGDSARKPGEIQLSFTVKPLNASDDAKTVEWWVSDESVLTVSESGLVKPLKSGKALVGVVNKLGQTASCAITVK